MAEYTSSYTGSQVDANIAIIAALAGAGYSGNITVAGDLTASSGSLSVTESANSTGGTIINTNASFTADILLCQTTKSASNTFNCQTWYNNAGGDLSFRFRGDGTATADGSFTGGGADYAEWFEWADGNPDNEDRCGMSVTLVGNKIALAQDGDELLGVISGNASVVGDGDIGRWKDKYLRDDFGRYLTEEYTVTQWVVSVDEGETISYESDRIPDDVIVPIEAEVISVDDYGNALTRRVLNPAYNPDAEYIEREFRKEWDKVGLLGKIRIRKGQPTDSRWRKMRDISDSVEEWFIK